MPTSEGLFGNAWDQDSSLSLRLATALAKNIAGAAPNYEARIRQIQENWRVEAWLKYGFDTKNCRLICKRRMMKNGISRRHGVPRQTIRLLLKEARTGLDVCGAMRMISESRPDGSWVIMLQDRWSHICLDDIAEYVKTNFDCDSDRNIVYHKVHKRLSKTMSGFRLFLSAWNALRTGKFEQWLDDREVVTRRLISSLFVADRIALNHEFRDGTFSTVFPHIRDGLMHEVEAEFMTTAEQNIAVAFAEFPFGHKRKIVRDLLPKANTNQEDVVFENSTQNITQSDESDGIKDWERHEHARTIRALILRPDAGLSLGEKEAILHKLAGLTDKQAADARNVQPGTHKQQLARARKKLSEYKPLKDILA